MNTYELIRSRRKTLALELTREGRLIVRAPLRISRREIDAFVEKHKDWIARHLAKRSPVGAGVVAVSGAVDLVTDGDRTFRLPGGSAMMTKITGAGCSLGGVTATYLAVAEPLVAALAASLLYDRASEIAEVKSDGPGSFQVALLDALWNVTADQVAASDIIETN